MRKICIYGVRLDAISSRSVAKYLYHVLKSNRQTFIFTPNLQMLSAARKDTNIAKLLNRADLSLADGIGVSLLCRTSIERIAGIDAGYALLKYSAAQGKRVFLLGGECGIAELAAKKLKEEIPTLRICGTHHGYFNKSVGSQENQQVITKINLARPHVILVCFGFPLQEKWICENAPRLSSAKIFMGLGGSLDVWSGRQKRAPLFFRAMGCEWLYRCICQPQRFISLIHSILG